MNSSQEARRDAPRGRTRNLLVGVLTSVPSRLVSLLSPLILIPFALGSIGVSAFGLWATAASVSALGAFADLGVGNGLLTRLTTFYTRREFGAARRLIASAYAFTTIIALVLLALASLILIWAIHAEVQIDSSLPQGEALGIIAVCWAAFAIGVPLALIQKVQYATAHVPLANFWLAAASLASAGAFVGARTAGMGVVISIGLSAFMFPIFSALNSLFFFGWLGRDLSPTRTRPSLEMAKRLARMGSMFFLIGVAVAVGQNMDLTLIAAALGLADSGEYAVALRLTGLLSTFFLLVTLPLWPATGSALADGDIAWVKRTSLKLVVVAVAAVGIPGVLIATVLQPVIAAWLGNAEAMPSQQVLFWLVAWNVLLAASSPLFMVQNAAGLLWPQLAGWTLFCAAALSAKLVLLPVFGAVAAPAVSSLSFLLLTLPFVIYGYRRVLNEKSA